MRILIDGRLYGYENTGIGRYVVNLLTELKKLDTKNRYIVLLQKKYADTLSFPDNWIVSEYNARHYTLKHHI